MTDRIDLQIRRGETWTYTYSYAPGGSPVDLSGYSAFMAIRAGRYGGMDAYLSTTGGSIALGADGSVALSLSASETAGLASGLTTSDTSRSYVAAPGVLQLLYDLKLQAPDGAIIYPIEGRIFVQEGITE